MTDNTTETIFSEVYYSLLEDYKNGIIHCGTNGPYDDPETKVRNLCNLIIASCANILAGNGTEDLKHIINRMSADLLSFEDTDSLYIIRNKKDKDLCNGVLGHAWVIEAFIYLYQVTNDPIYIEKSQKIYFLHKFNDNIGVWSCPNKFGGKIDMTINHQIWFAGVAAELYSITKNQYIYTDLSCFEKKFWNNTKVHSNGLFCHYVQTWNGINKIKNNIRNIIDKTKTLLNLPSMNYKENGYHMFCLCGLARLKLSGVGDKIFCDNKFIRALEYCNSKTYFSMLEINNHERDVSTLTDKERMNDVNCNFYGYPYNAPGFEVEYVRCAFGVILEQTVSKLEERQIAVTYNRNTKLFDQNAIDIYDLCYKVYEKLITTII